MEAQSAPGGWPALSGSHLLHEKGTNGLGAWQAKERPIPI